MKKYCEAQQVGTDVVPTLHWKREYSGGRKRLFRKVVLNAP